MYLESSQTEDHYREEQQLKITLLNLAKFCQQNLDHLRGIF